MSTTEQDNAIEDLYDGESVGQYWHAQIEHAKTVFDHWEKRGDRVVERFRDERSATEQLRSKFNILWSNVQVLAPSLYGRQAKPEVSRRYMDADPVGRLASTMLERTIEYEVHQFPDFHSAMLQTVEDRLLPGRGTVWMRYEPVIVSETIGIPDVEGEQITSSEEIQVEHIQTAHAPVDYVYWKDFLHSPARTWDEVWWVLRWVYMTKDEGIERFGDVFKNVPLNSYIEDNGKSKKEKSQFSPKAKVAEIWNKRTAKVCWVAEGYAQALDERDDPLGLEEFFPCPKPLYATTTNGSLIPVPDYCEYEDQARELDSITGRITTLVKAVKAVGVYNGEFKELTRLLSEGQDNKLFPVTNWSNLAEKNGLTGAVDMLDISVTLQALTALYGAREAVKQTIYEICGISDILRGTSKAEETLGAQQLKANFGSLRLRHSQAEVARFASDIFKLKAQIICKYYPPQLIMSMSGIQNTPDGNNPDLVSQAMAMLGNADIRDFHIAVESDSLSQIDDQEEKAAAAEAINAIGGFVEKALPMAQQAPETVPMVSEMLLFLVRRYRAGRGLEASIEQSMKAITAKASQPKGPTPEQIEAQLQQQSDQARIAADVQASQAKAQQDAAVQQAKLQAESQLEQQKMQMDLMRSRFEAQIEATAAAQEQQMERFKSELDSRTKLAIAEMDRQTKLEIAMFNAQSTASAPQPAGPDPDLEWRKAELDASTKIRVAEISNEAKLAAASMKPEPEKEKPEPKEPSAASSPVVVSVNTGNGGGQQELPGIPASSEKKIRYKVVRNDKGRISELIPVEDGGEPE